MDLMHTKAEAPPITYLSQQTAHPCVRVYCQAQRRRQRLLVLQTAGVEPGPELHLQLTVLLLRELELCDTALQLQDDSRDRRLLIQNSLAAEERQVLLRTHQLLHKDTEVRAPEDTQLPRSPPPALLPSSESPRRNPGAPLSLCRRSEQKFRAITIQLSRCRRNRGDRGVTKD